MEGSNGEVARENSKQQESFRRDSDSLLAGLRVYVLSKLVKSKSRPVDVEGRKIHGLREGLIYAESQLKA